MGKKKVYFDYNVFEYVNKNHCDVSWKSMFDIFCSVAHAEEYYKAYCNANDKDLPKKTYDVIEEVKKIGVVLNPSPIYTKPIIEKKELFFDCVERCRRQDTRNEIRCRENWAVECDKAIYENLKKDDGSVVNNSTLACEKIWQKHEVRNILVEALKDNDFYEESLLFANDNIEVGRCMDYRKYSFCKFRDLVEILYRVLNMSGYNNDKVKEDMSSRVHDISHIIYASYCDYFVTLDQRLVKKARAIYWLANIETKLITYEDFLKLAQE